MAFVELDHTLDTLGTSVLNTFKTQNVFKNAVIAGGYVRDQINKKSFKDIDIFIPKVPINAVVSGHMSLPLDYKVFRSGHENFGQNHQYDMNFAVWDINYLENIKIQLIMTHFPEKDFHQHLLSSFDFGICQVFSAGHEIYGTEEFLFDQKRNCATLLNLRSMNDLTRHMKRFFRIQEKYPEMIFRCPNLEIKKGKEVVDSDPQDAYKPFTLVPSPQQLSQLVNITQANQVFQGQFVDSQGIPEPPESTLDDAVNEMYLNYDLDDILHEYEGEICLNWVVLDEMLVSSNADVIAHTQALIEQYENL